MRPFLTLHHPAAAMSYYNSGLWQKDTFYSLLQHNARNFGDRIALVDSRRSLTWAQLKAWTDGIAADLKTFGLVKGDRVSSWISNRAESVALFLACSREGFVYNPSLHRSHTCDEVGNYLRRLAPRAFVSEKGWGADRDVASLDSVLADISSLKVVYQVDNLPQEAPNLTPCDTDPDTVVYIAFTSGTTGEPKFVMHSDNTLLCNARELVRDWHLNDDAVILTLSPLSHHIAWVAAGQWLIAGCRLVANDPPEGTSTLDWVIDNKATYLMGVPTHAIDLLAQQREKGVALGSVDMFYMAGSPIPPAVCENLVSQGIRPQNVYGMTENSSHQYTLPHDGTEIILTTCGRGGQAYEVRIFDPSDPNRALGPNTVGQIGGRGAALMLGYYASQKATEESFNDKGWFMSGDLGALDEQGNLRIVGRLKDTIIRGGHNIYPSGIEAASVRHPDVHQAACVPIPDSRLGERVCLAVSGAVEWRSLLDHLKQAGISRFDMPEYLVRLETFPTTASGKILKRRLSDMVNSQEVPVVPVAGIKEPTLQTEAMQ